MTPSFPSGHATLSAVVYLTLGALLMGIVRGRASKAYCIAVAMLLTLLVGASRVYLGVHWVSDVVAALVLGSLYLVGVEWLLEWHHERMPCAAFVVRGRDLDEDLATRRPKALRQFPDPQSVV